MKCAYFDVYREEERLTAEQVTELFLNRRPTRGEVELIEARGVYAKGAATNHHDVSWVGMFNSQEARVYRIKETRVEIMIGDSITNRCIPPIKIGKTGGMNQARKTIEKYLPGCTLKEVCSS